MARKPKTYERNIDGLIDACFDQLQDLRDGISNAHETIAFAKTAEIIVRGVETNMKSEALRMADEQRKLELNVRSLQLTYERENAQRRANQANNMEQEKSGDNGAGDISRDSGSDD